MTNPSVTGLNIKQRMSAFIKFLLSLQEKNERIIASAPVALLPAPRAVVTASTWERYPDPCLICGQPMTKSLFDKDKYFCLPCDQAVADEARENLVRIQTGRINALALPAGKIAKRVREATPGTYARDMRHAWQEEGVRGIFAELSTVKELPQLPSALRSTINKPPTGPLPARDIQYAPTPQPTPHTPIPEARGTLFADIPHQATYSEDDECESTEKRPRVSKSTDTIQITAMRAEAILLDMMHSSETHPQSTGENERLPAKSNAWML
jgi:hypothetical protein